MGHGQLPGAVGKPADDGGVEQIGEHCVLEAPGRAAVFVEVPALAHEKFKNGPAVDDLDVLLQRAVPIAPDLLLMEAFGHLGHGVQNPGGQRAAGGGGDEAGVGDAHIHLAQVDGRGPLALLIIHNADHRGGHAGGDGGGHCDDGEAGEMGGTLHLVDALAAPHTHQDRAAFRPSQRGIGLGPGDGAVIGVAADHTGDTGGVQAFPRGIHHPVHRGGAAHKKSLPAQTHDLSRQKGDHSLAVKEFSAADLQRGDSFHLRSLFL